VKADMTPDEKYELQRTKNRTAFELLYDVEVILRELCAAKLEALHGKKWPKRGLPPDVFEKVKDSVAYEQKSKWHRAILHHPLYYIDFPDLKKILISGSNWGTLFAEIFGHKPGTESSLSELELLRNQIAHNRFVSDADLTILRGVHSKLLQSIRTGELDAAKSAANNRVPVSETLRTLAGGVDVSLSAMTTAGPLRPEDVPDASLASAWWFDEGYLGVGVEDVKSFLTLCANYSKLQRGVGQAIARRHWVVEHDALSQGTKAQTAMTDILLKGQNHYD